MPNSRKAMAKPRKSALIVPKGRRESDPESAGDLMAGMKGGEARVGRNYTIKPRPVPEKESLDAEGIARKRALRSLLMSVLLPNSLSSKSSPEQDRRSLIGKLNKRTLKELKGFVPDRINRMSAEKLQMVLDGTEEITDDEKVEMQDIYKNISP